MESEKYLGYFERMISNISEIFWKRDLEIIFNIYRFFGISISIQYEIDEIDKIIY